MAFEPDQIKELQQALIQGHYPNVSATGVFVEPDRNALQQLIVGMQMTTAYKSLHGNAPPTGVYDTDVQKILDASAKIQPDRFQAIATVLREHGGQLSEIYHPIDADKMAKKIDDDRTTRNLLRDITLESLGLTETGTPAPGDPAPAGTEGGDPSTDAPEGDEPASTWGALATPGNIALGVAGVAVLGRKKLIYAPVKSVAGFVWSKRPFQGAPPLEVVPAAATPGAAAAVGSVVDGDTPEQARLREIEQANRVFELERLRGGRPATATLAATPTDAPESVADGDGPPPPDGDDAPTPRRGRGLVDRMLGRRRRAAQGHGATPVDPAAHVDVAPLVEAPPPVETPHLTATARNLTDGTGGPRTPVAAPSPAAAAPIVNYPDAQIKSYAEDVAANRPQGNDDANWNRAVDEMRAAGVKPQAPPTAATPAPANGQPAPAAHEPAPAARTGAQPASAHGAVSPASGGSVLFADAPPAAPPVAPSAPPRSSLFGGEPVPHAPNAPVDTPTPVETTTPVGDHPTASVPVSRVERMGGKIGIFAVAVAETDALLKGNIEKAVEVPLVTAAVYGVTKVAAAKAIPGVGQVVGAMFAGYEAYQNGWTARGVLSGIESGLYTVAAGAGVITAGSAATGVGLPIAAVAGTVGLVTGTAALMISGGKAVYDSRNTIAGWFGSSKTSTTPTAHHAAPAPVVQPNPDAVLERPSLNQNAALTTAMREVFPGLPPRGQAIDEATLDNPENMANLKRLLRERINKEEKVQKDNPYVKPGGFGESIGSWLSAQRAADLKRRDETNSRNEAAQHKLAELRLAQQQLATYERQTQAYNTQQAQFAQRDAAVVAAAQARQPDAVVRSAPVQQFDRDETMRVQEALVKSGDLKRDDFVPGVWNAATERGKDRFTVKAQLTAGYEDGFKATHETSYSKVDGIYGNAKGSATQAGINARVQAGQIDADAAKVFEDLGSRMSRVRNVAAIQQEIAAENNGQTLAQLRKVTLDPAANAQLARAEAPPAPLTAPAPPPLVVVSAPPPVVAPPAGPTAPPPVVVAVAPPPVQNPDAGRPIAQSTGENGRSVFDNPYLREEALAARAEWERTHQRDRAGTQGGAAGSLEDALGQSQPMTLPNGRTVMAPRGQGDNRRWLPHSRETLSGVFSGGDRQNSDRRGQPGVRDVNVPIDPAIRDLPVDTAGGSLQQGKKFDRVFGTVDPNGISRQVRIEGKVHNGASDFRAATVHERGRVDFKTKNNYIFNNMGGEVSVEVQGKDVTSGHFARFVSGTQATNSSPVVRNVSRTTNESLQPGQKIDADYNTVTSQGLTHVHVTGRVGKDGNIEFKSESDIALVDGGSQRIKMKGQRVSQRDFAQLQRTGFVEQLKHDVQPGNQTTPQSQTLLASAETDANKRRANGQSPMGNP